MSRWKFYTFVIGVMAISYWYLTPTEITEPESIEAMVTEYVEEIEYSEIEEIENLELTLNEWESYTPSLASLPDLSKIFGMREAKATVMGVNQSPELVAKAKSILGDSMHPELPTIISELNPYNAGIEEVFKSGWNIGYGVTQINLKLIPLANLSYSDFETNPTSQIRFLNDYITVKREKGKTINQIVDEYKYCDVQ